jgi:hypothetical protein
VGRSLVADKKEIGMNGEKNNQKLRASPRTGAGKRGLIGK